MASTSKNTTVIIITIYATHSLITTHTRNHSSTLSRANLQKKKNGCSSEIPITVVGDGQKWTFHCGSKKPLSITLFAPLEKLMAQGGRCFLIFNGVVDGKMGPHMLDRKKTPSHYGMTYDETVHLGGVIHCSV